MQTPSRILLGPGPSAVHPRVLSALAAPLVGHLDPFFIELMEEAKRSLRSVFLTENELTLPISGTGSAGPIGETRALSGKERSPDGYSTVSDNFILC